ncbi:F-box protein At3g07870-like [Salvia splendens]|uniref:F-box protein At3g07870-like n=1 Tax=Salvia splendens TaxID=180675 RepID=UPI001C255B4A|nr:F-box protein At3g07870-like [Salvia splendens]
MEKDFSTILPQEIWRDILGRLPIRSFMRCKFVCKSWGDMIEGGDIESSTPKSLLAFGNRDTGYAICDEAGQPLFQFGSPHYNCSRDLVDSVNGLLLVWDSGHKYHLNLLICNPITSKYVELPLLPVGSSYIFGFGVSKLSGQYKIVSGDRWRPHHVYTLERGGLWRSIAAEETTTRFSLPTHMSGAFFNGNLHWLASDSERNHVVCCFDLETELSTMFSLPADAYGYNEFFGLCVLDCLLCLCDSSKDSHVFIWTMNNYGDVSSWGNDVNHVK